MQLLVHKNPHGRDPWLDDVSRSSSSVGAGVPVPSGCSIASLGGSAVLAGAWILGVGGQILRHWGVRLTLRREALVLESGLTTARRLEVPLARVQLVQTNENLVRRWFGYGSFTVESAAPRSSPPAADAVSAVRALHWSQAALGLASRARARALCSSFVCS